MLQTRVILKSNWAQPGEKVSGRVELALLGNSLPLPLTLTQQPWNYKAKEGEFRLEKVRGEKLSEIRNGGDTFAVCFDNTGEHELSASVLGLFGSSTHLLVLNPLLFNFGFEDPPEQATRATIVFFFPEWDNSASGLIDLDGETIFFELDKRTSLSGAPLYTPGYWPREPLTIWLPRAPRALVNFSGWTDSQGHPQWKLVYYSLREMRILPGIPYTFNGATGTVSIWPREK